MAEEDPEDPGGVRPGRGFKFRPAVRRVRRRLGASGGRSRAAAAAVRSGGGRGAAALGSGPSLRKGRRNGGPRRPWPRDRNRGRDPKPAAAAGGPAHGPCHFGPKLPLLCRPRVRTHGPRPPGVDRPRSRRRRPGPAGLLDGTARHEIRVGPKCPFPARVTEARGLCGGPRVKARPSAAFGIGAIGAAQAR